MTDRSKDWLGQAYHDLDQARLSMGAAQYDWACFAAHQAAEKAIKAMFLNRRHEVWGHVTRRLLSEANELTPPVDVPDQLLDKARALDALYIPTRYPNGHPEGAPYENYGELQAREAIQYAEEIVVFCANAMA